MKNKLYQWYVTLMVALYSSLAMAQIDIIDVIEPPSQSEPVLIMPTRQDVLSLPALAAGSDFQLLGVRNAQILEFTLRRDQIVHSAELNLVFTPSPALLPRLSHLRVYLNDELMGVINVESEFLGQQISKKIALNPLMMTRFNRVRLEFIGHYTDICEDLTHSSLWLDLSRDTQIIINQQALPVANDLAYFPEPFFDDGDMEGQEIPFVFAGAPSTQQLEASAILASYFGKEARWRDLSFPVYFGQLPTQHVVVFAKNDARPEFLRDYPPVQGPTVELVSLPGSDYYKMLLVLGTDDADLVTAASALALGNPLFRGRSVSIDAVQELTPRKPYDAPNWVATDRPVYFSELMSYPGQLEVSGLMPRPIDLELNLPPDLFVWRNSGIPLQLYYRYVAPKTSDESRLTLSLNNHYVDSYILKSSDEQGVLKQLRISLRGTETSRADERLLVPAIKIGSKNQIRFDFSYASTLGSAQRDMCQTVLPVDVRAAIDENSVIDFSGYAHYMAMPNLHVFANSAYPFSRMADLSETVVVMPKQPTALQTATFLETIAAMGAQIGYPALKIRVMSDWEQASQIDADVLLIGEMPEAIKMRPDANLLLKDTESSLRQPRLSHLDVEPKNSSVTLDVATEYEAQSQVSLRALAPMAAIVGLQADHFPQRSIVGLFATTDDDFRLLREALASSGKRDAMAGSVVLIRESGVAAEMVGSTYYVGYLVWWERVWYYLSDKPFLIAALAFLLVVFFALLLWVLLRQVARKRLEQDA